MANIFEAHKINVNEFLLLFGIFSMFSSNITVGLYRSVMVNAS